MIIKNIKKVATSLIVSSSLLVAFAAAPAFAENVNATTSTSTKLKENQTQKLSDLIAKFDKEIAARIASLNTLNTLNTKVQSLKNVSSTEKSNISTMIQTEITNLTNAKVKVDADTELSTAKSDAISAINSSRIYALVIPQGKIEVSVDRINTIVGLINGIATKLQVRITAAKTAGKDVTALQTALSDITTQTAAATAQAASAQTGVSSLVPDGGNKTTLASNTAALKSARDNVKSATAHLKTARQDIKTITNGLKAFHPIKSTTATTTTTVSQ